MNNHVTDKSSDIRKSMAILEEIGIENIVGSPGAETITGDANANYLAGGNYGSSSTVNDTINGADGNDMLMGSYNCSG